MCALVVVFCLFVVLQSWFKGVRLWRQKRQRDRLRPTPPCLFMSLRLHANTHTNTSHTTQTHPLAPAYFFTLRRKIVETPSSTPCLHCLPSSGILYQQREACLFLPGMSSPGNPTIMALFSINEGPTTPPHSSPHPPLPSVFSIPLTHT